MFDTLFHRWLLIPYSLNVHYNYVVSKPRATVVFVHGIGNSGASWDEVIKKLPKDIRVITIDLLGFGKSKKPSWAIYNAHTQVRSLVATYRRLGLRGPVLLVGHSMGSLVSIELAKHYPRIVSALVLCSPPLYQPDLEVVKLFPGMDMLLKDLYRRINNYPNQVVAISKLAMRYGLINKGFSVTDENIHSYMAALEASIINQTSIEDAKKLKLPTRIIYGTLDPVVIIKNLKEVEKANDNVRVKSVIAGHEVKGRQVNAVLKAIDELLPGNKDSLKS